MQTPTAKPTGVDFTRATILAWAVVTVAFHIWLIFSGLVPNLVSRPLHLLLSIPWIFFIGTKGSAASRALAYAVGGLGIAACLYIILDRDHLLDQYGTLQGWLQHGVALVVILVVLDMARRAIKPVLPSVALVALAYGLFGHLIPGEYGHDGLPLESFLGTLVIAEGGLWGELTAISATVVAPFLILGAVIAAGDAGEGFMAIAKRVAGRYRAGSAKVEVVASALYGTISGSASANVAGTGTFTIPNMIKLGYPPKFAAAVEAVASTGGQITPPIMGAGAFLMAEMLRVTYADIMAAAVLPAALFYVITWIGCHCFAYVYGLKGLPQSELPSWAHVGRTAPFFLMPFGILVLMLLLTDYTPQYGCVIAIAATTLLLIVDHTGRVDWARWGRRLAQAAVEASEQIAMIAAVIVCAGIIVGVLQMTGLGVKVTSAILSIAAGKLWLALILTAIACIILGMEVPTTAAYIICVSVAAPALGELGLDPLVTHFFIFWYALLSTITPPVCGTVYIAAGIAQTPWLPVAGTAMRLGLGLFLVPPAFVANPALLRPDEGLFLALLAAVRIATGIGLLSFATIGAGGRLWVRAAAAVAGLCLIFALGA
ncbi:MAG TPA: TRAP transporter fused permease subunit [Alphaproteobacteria bacterium]|nr:TRAP transporter fused permease subunit [Alphaproteobacteria bacterium]